MLESNACSQTWKRWYKRRDPGFLFFAFECIAYIYFFVFFEWRRYDQDMYPYASRLLPVAYQDKIHLLVAPNLDKEERAALAAGLESDAIDSLLLPPI